MPRRGGMSGAELATGYISLSVRYKSAMSQIGKDVESLEGTATSVGNRAGQAIESGIAGGASGGVGKAKSILESELSSSHASSVGHNWGQSFISNAGSAVSSGWAGLHGNLVQNAEKTGLTVGNSIGLGARGGFSLLENAGVSAFHRVESEGKAIFSRLESAAGSVFSAFTGPMAKMIGLGALVGGIGYTFTKGFEHLENIQNATAMLEGMGFAARDVNQMFANINDSIKNTQYGVNDVMASATKLMEMGIKPGAELTKTLKEIENTAAGTGMTIEQTTNMYVKMATRDYATLRDMVQQPVIAARIKADYHMSPEDFAQALKDHAIGMDKLEHIMTDDFAGVAEQVFKGSFTAQLHKFGENIADIGQAIIEPFFNNMTGGMGTLNDKMAQWVDWLKSHQGEIVGFFEKVAVGAEKFAASALITLGDLTIGIGHLIHALGTLTFNDSLKKAGDDAVGYGNKMKGWSDDITNTAIPATEKFFDKLQNVTNVMGALGTATMAINDNGKVFLQDYNQATIDKLANLHIKVGAGGELTAITPEAAQELQDTLDKLGLKAEVTPQFTNWWTDAQMKVAKMPPIKVDIEPDPSKLDPAGWGAKWGAEFRKYILEPGSPGNSLPSTQGSPGNSLPSTQGHWATGGFGRMPRSATIQSAVHPGGLVNWAEPSTGGEAYIPLGSANHARSVGIWKQTGHILSSHGPMHGLFTNPMGTGYGEMLHTTGPMHSQGPLSTKVHFDKGGVLQVIWNNTATGEKVGEAGGQFVGPGTAQPGYYRDNWAGHTGHVHTSFSSGPKGEFYGLKKGTEIHDGGPGFPPWVYDLGNQFGLEASTYAGHQEGSGFNRGIDWFPKHHDDMSGASYSKAERADLDDFAHYISRAGVFPGAKDPKRGGARNDSGRGESGGSGGSGESKTGEGGANSSTLMLSDVIAAFHGGFTGGSTGGTGDSGYSGTPGGAAGGPHVGAGFGGGTDGGGAPASQSGFNWDEVARAESSNNWQNADTGKNGHYGGLQFSPATWNAFGGQEFAAMPNQATREQQIIVANRTAFGGYNGTKPQGLGAWETITNGSANVGGVNGTDPKRGGNRQQPFPADGPFGGDTGTTTETPKEKALREKIDKLNGDLRVAGEKQDELKARKKPPTPEELKAAKDHIDDINGQVGAAQDQLRILQSGGTKTDVAEGTVQATISKLKADLKVAQDKVDELTDPKRKKPASQSEIDAAKNRVTGIQTKIDDAEKKASTLPGNGAGGPAGGGMGDINLSSLADTATSGLMQTFLPPGFVNPFSTSLMHGASTLMSFIAGKLPDPNMGRALSLGGALMSGKGGNIASAIKGFIPGAYGQANVGSPGSAPGSTGVNFLGGGGGGGGLPLPQIPGLPKDVGANAAGNNVTVNTGANYAGANFGVGPNDFKDLVHTKDMASARANTNFDIPRIGMPGG